MNKYQRLVIVAALMNMLVILLFPPFTSQPLAKGMLPGFDGFYPVFTQFGNKSIFKELLTLQLMFIGINTLAAWLALQSRKHHGDPPDFSFMSAIGWFSAVNLALIFTFPPFEPYRTLLRADAGGFESFYFVFGRRSQPAIFWPLLYLECTFILINALGFILLFSAVKGGDDAARGRSIPLPGEAAGARHKPEDKNHLNSAALGRGVDRRHEARPHAGEERRAKEDRRTVSGSP
jgi:hypothetical protein